MECWPLNRFNSSISSRLSIWASRRSRFCSDNCSWRSNWSRWDCSSLVIAWSISQRRDSTNPFNSWILLLSESAWTSCLWISVPTSARICSVCLSRRILILSFSTSRLDFRFWHELSSYTGLPVLVCAKKGLSLQQTLFTRVISLSQVRWFFSLLHEQWWRERFSDSLIVEFRIARVRILRVYVAGFILEDRCRSLRVVEVVEVVGLITCERVVYRHGAILLIVRECSGFMPRRFRPHGSWWAGQRTGRQWVRK